MIPSLSGTPRAAGLGRVSIYDVSLKGISVLQTSLFIDELVRRQIGEWRLTGFLSTEFPRTAKLFADLLGRCGPSEIIHIEFQSSNDATMQWRMLEYYVETVRLHGTGPDDATTVVRQFVVYVGKGRMSMLNRLSHPGLQFSFHLIDI